MPSSAGSPPSKVYGNIRAVASRAAERFWAAPPRTGAASPGSWTHEMPRATEAITFLVDLEAQKKTRTVCAVWLPLDMWSDLNIPNVSVQSLNGILNCVCIKSIWFLLEQPQAKTCFITDFLNIRLKRLLLQKALAFNVLSLKELAELSIYNHTSWFSIFLKKGGFNWNTEFNGRLSTESLLLLEQCNTWKREDEEVNNIFELNPEYAHL